MSGEKEEGIKRAAQLDVVCRKCLDFARKDVVGAGETGPAADDQKRPEPVDNGLQRAQDVSHLHQGASGGSEGTDLHARGVAVLSVARVGEMQVDLDRHEGSSTEVSASSRGSLSGRLGAHSRSHPARPKGVACF